MEFEVFAEHFGKTEEYTEEGIDVIRCWRRGKTLDILSMFWRVLWHKNKVVFFPFELMIFGSQFHALIAILAAIGLRISGKRVVLVVHQIVSDFAELHPHNPFNALLNFAKNVLYLLMEWASSITVVFEAELNRQLPFHTNVVVIPHAVERFDPMNKAKARHELGWHLSKRYVLYFGYLSPYKGVDRLIEAWEPNSRYELVMCGGPNAQHAKNATYMKQIAAIKQQAKEKGVQMPGYVHQEDIKAYYSACDAVILPYRVFLSSSGPLSIAFSFGKPVILSKQLAPYFRSPDWRGAAHVTGLQKEDMLIDFDYPFLPQLESIFDQIETGKKFSETMREQRSWDALAHDYIRVFKRYETD